MDSDEPKESTKPAGWVNVSDAHFAVWEEGQRANDFEGTRDLYREMLDQLRARGWSLRQDRRKHRSLQPDHHVGRKGDLQAETSRGGRMFEVKFFQTVTPADNPHGAVYDFRRVAAMPPAVRLRYLVETAALLDWVHRRRGYWFSGKEPWKRGPRPADDTRPMVTVVRDVLRGVVPGDDPLAYFNECWAASRFRRGPDGWPLPSECASGGAQCVDRDGRPLLPGVVKYARHHDGRLWRGRVYPRVNSMWFLPIGEQQVLHNQGYFHDYAGEPLRRAHPGRKARLMGLLDKAVEAQDFERAIVLRDLLKKDAAKATEKGHAHGR
jgi:hypothetical protein